MGGKRNPSWVFWRLFFEIDLEVFELHWLVENANSLVNVSRYEKR